MGGGVSNDISDSAHTIHSTKVMYILHGRVFFKRVKEILEFQFLNF